MKTTRSGNFLLQFFFDWMKSLFGELQKVCSVSSFNPVVEQGVQYLSTLMPSFSLVHDIKFDQEKSFCLFRAENNKIVVRMFHANFFLFLFDVSVSLARVICFNVLSNTKCENEDRISPDYAIKRGVLKSINDMNSRTCIPGTSEVLASSLKCDKGHILLITSWSCGKTWKWLIFFLY